MDRRFLGICIVIASLMLSAALLYTSLFAGKEDRYKVVGARVFDTHVGKFIEDESLNTSETINNEKETTQETITQNSNIQVLDNTIVQYNVELPEEGDTLASILSSNDIKITIKNLSNKYIINYIEAEIKVYKDDVVFLKDIIIIDYKEEFIGHKEALKINPLSSYKTVYRMDSKITYPDKPWTSEVTTKIVKGFPIE